MACGCELAAIRPYQYWLLSCSSLIHWRNWPPQTDCLSPVLGCIWKWDNWVFSAANVLSSTHVCVLSWWQVYMATMGLGCFSYYFLKAVLSTVLCTDNLVMESRRVLSGSLYELCESSASEMCYKEQMVSHLNSCFTLKVTQSCCLLVTLPDSEQ